MAYQPIGLPSCPSLSRRLMYRRKVRFWTSTSWSISPKNAPEKMKVMVAVAKIMVAHHQALCNKPKAFRSTSSLSHFSSIPGMASTCSMMRSWRRPSFHASM